jgi:hypothetical protein
MRAPAIVPKTLILWRPEGDLNLSRLAGVYARRQNPERSRGTSQLWCPEGGLDADDPKFS